MNSKVNHESKINLELTLLITNVPAKVHPDPNDEKPNKVSFSMGTSQTLLNYSRFVKDVYSKTKGVVHIDFEDAQKAVEKMINLYIK